MLVKSLVALATEKMLLKTSGKTFLKGIAFMYAAGLAPERLSVMMTSSLEYIWQFHSKCDIHPFAIVYPSFAMVLRDIVYFRAWRIKSIEFVNVAFDIKDVDNLERTIDMLGVELVLLRNCTYPNIEQGEQAIKLLNALNRKKLAVVCEYGDERLKHKIAKRRERQVQDRSTDVNVQEVAGQNVTGVMRVVMNALGRRYSPSLLPISRRAQREMDEAMSWMRRYNQKIAAEMLGEPVEPAEQIPDDAAPHDMELDDAIDRVGDEPMSDDGEEVKEDIDDDDL